MSRHILYNGIMGLAIGDAMGVPHEFKSRDCMKNNPVTGFIGGGIWNQPEGTWSDDTAMTLATIDALNNNEWKVTDKCLADIMDNFLKWYLNGEYAACGVRFDIGNTCELAIAKWKIHRTRSNEFVCTGVGGNAYGNGALMRMLPCIFLSNEDTDKIGRLTHDSNLCSAVNIFYIKLLRNIIKNRNKIEAFDIAKETSKKYLENIPLKFMRTTTEEFMNIKDDDIKSSGYVIDTIEAAVWCFLTTDNYRDCILKAVNLGNDTDTIAAIAGSMAGLYYGINEDNGIPNEWINKLRDIDTIKNLLYK